MSTAIRLSPSLSAHPTAYNQDGAPRAAFPFSYGQKLPAPVSAAVNPVYELELTPTSGTAATLPGSLVLNGGSAALSSLTATLVARRPLDVSQTWIGLDNILGFELRAYALPKTTAEIEAGGSPTRACAGTLTLTYSDIGNVYTAKFGINDFGQTAVLSAFSPRDLSLGAGADLDLTVTVALTEFSLNTKLTLLVICRG